MSSQTLKPPRRFAVDVTRIAYSTKRIIVEAANQEQAMRKAEAEAPNHSFDHTHTANYEADSATALT